jgi:anti-sigma B factor antagonist
LANKEIYLIQILKKLDTLDTFYIKISDMKYSVDKRDHYTIFTLQEDNLNSVIAPDLKADFILLQSEGIRNFILDLSPVNFVDSSGLSAILTANRLWKGDNGSFVLMGINNPNVKKLIEISRLDSILAISPNLTGAIEHIRMEEVERRLRKEFED